MTIQRTVLTTYEMPLDCIFQEVLDTALQRFSGERGKTYVMEVVPPASLIRTTPAHQREDVYAPVENFGRFLAWLSSAKNNGARSDRGKPMITATIAGERRSIEIEMDGSERGIVRLILQG